MTVIVSRTSYMFGFASFTGEERCSLKVVPTEHLQEHEVLHMKEDEGVPADDVQLTADVEPCNMDFSPDFDTEREAMIGADDALFDATVARPTGVPMSRNSSRRQHVA